MKLESVSITRYRSAYDVQLPYVGDFNVFIGKNNSGKSTLLRAIKSFFACLKRGNVTALDAPIGRESIDFSYRKATEPMEIAATFSMQLAERDALRMLQLDRKSTRLNSSHTSISYAVFSLKQKK